MLEITEIKLSKNPVSTGEQFKISIQIVEKKSYLIDTAQISGFAGKSCEAGKRITQKENRSD